MKIVTVLLLGLVLVGCGKVPTSNNEYVRFINNNGNAITLPLYTSSRFSSYNHYMCIDGDAVAVVRDRKDHHIVDVNAIGKNCAKYTIDISKIEDVK